MNAIEIARRVYFRNDNNIWAESSAYNSCENLVRNAILSSIFFTSLYPLITWVLRNIFPHRIRNLDNDEKRFKELVGYLYSLVHHLVVVPWALMALYNECLKSDEEWRLVNFALEYSFLPPYCFGYLMGDLIMYAAPRAREGRLDMLTHHVLGLGMILCACLTTPPVVRFQVHMVLLEGSSVCFSFAWLGRTFGCSGAAWVAFMEKSFVASFFVLRLLHFSLVLWALSDVLLAQYPVLCLIFAPLLAMQFYWFYLIVTYKKKAIKTE